LYFSYFSLTKKFIVWTTENLQLHADGPSTLTKGFESNFSPPCTVGAECIDGKKSCRRERVWFGQAPRACIVAPYDSGVSRRSRDSIFPARSPAPHGRNDFRNMINCLAVAFRRRRDFHTNYGYFSAVVNLCDMCFANQGNWHLHW